MDVGLICKTNKKPTIMKKLIFLLAIASFTAQSIKAQTTAPADTTANLQNSWYFEFAGASITGATFNYERFLSKTAGGLSIHGGIGGGLIPHIFDNGSDFFGVFTGGISYNIPVTTNKRGMIELGGIYTYYSGQILSQFGDNSTYGTGVPAALISWRHLSASGKTQIRATVLGLIGPRSQVLPWVGFSIGRRF
jgi:hypothetical protein